MRPLPVPLLLLLPTSLAQYTIVFNYYWQDYSNDCEASCLTSVFNVQQCTLSNACSSNNCMTLDYSCLCGTTSWLNATSQCIGENCGAAAVYEAASILSNECKTAGVAMAISEDKIVQVGLAVAPSTTSLPKPTGTSSSGGKGSKGSSGGGLSTVIIGVVTLIAGFIVAMVGVFYGWKQYKHSKAQMHDGKGHLNHQAGSSTTTLTRLPEAQARDSASEERQ